MWCVRCVVCIMWVCTLVCVCLHGCARVYQVGTLEARLSSATMDLTALRAGREAIDAAEEKLSAVLAKEDVAEREEEREMGLKRLYKHSSGAEVSLFDYDVAFAYDGGSPTASGPCVSVCLTSESLPSSAPPPPPLLFSPPPLSSSSSLPHTHPVLPVGAPGEEDNAIVQASTAASVALSRAERGVRWASSAEVAGTVPNIAAGARRCAPVFVCVCLCVFALPNILLRFNELPLPFLSSFLRHRIVLCALAF